MLSRWRSYVSRSSTSVRFSGSGRHVRSVALNRLAGTCGALCLEAPPTDSRTGSISGAHVELPQHCGVGLVGHGPGPPLHTQSRGGWSSCCKRLWPHRLREPPITVRRKGEIRHKNCMKTVRYGEAFGRCYPSVEAGKWGGTQQSGVAGRPKGGAYDMT